MTVSSTYRAANKMVTDLEPSQGPVSEAIINELKGKLSTIKALSRDDASKVQALENRINALAARANSAAAAPSSLQKPASLTSSRVTSQPQPAQPQPQPPRPAAKPAEQPKQAAPQPAPRQPAASAQRASLALNRSPSPVFTSQGVPAAFNFAGAPSRVESKRSTGAPQPAQFPAPIPEPQMESKGGVLGEDYLDGQTSQPTSQPLPQPQTPPPASNEPSTGRKVLSGVGMIAGGIGTGVGMVAGGLWSVTKAIGRNTVGRALSSTPATPAAAQPAAQTQQPTVVAGNANGVATQQPTPVLTPQQLEEQQTDLAFAEVEKNLVALDQALAANRNALPDGYNDKTRLIEQQLNDLAIKVYDERTAEVWYDQNARLARLNLTIQNRVGQLFGQQPAAPAPRLESKRDGKEQPVPPARPQQRPSVAPMTAFNGTPFTMGPDASESPYSSLPPQSRHAASIARTPYLSSAADAERNRAAAMDRLRSSSRANGSQPLPATPSIQTLRSQAQLQQSSLNSRGETPERAAALQSMNDDRNHRKLAEASAVNGQGLSLQPTLMPLHTIRPVGVQPAQQSQPAPAQAPRSLGLTATETFGALEALLNNNATLAKKMNELQQDTVCARHLKTLLQVAPNFNSLTQAEQIQAIQRAKTVLALNSLSFALEEENASAAESAFERIADLNPTMADRIRKNHFNLKIIQDLKLGLLNLAQAK